MSALGVPAGRDRRAAERSRRHWRAWGPPLATGPAPPAGLGCGAGGGEELVPLCCGSARPAVPGPRPAPPARPPPWSPALTAPLPPAPLPSVRAGFARRAACGPARPCLCRWSSCYTIDARSTRISSSFAGTPARPAPRPGALATALSPDRRLPAAQPHAARRDSCPGLGPARSSSCRTAVLRPLPPDAPGRLCPLLSLQNCQKFS